jgi:hypothetical protein
LRIATLAGDVGPDFVKFSSNLRSEEKGHEPRSPLRVESHAPSLLYFLGEIPHRILVHRDSLVTGKRHLSLIHGSENFATAAFVFFPELQRFLDGFFCAANPAILDGLANESFLVCA